MAALKVHWSPSVKTSVSQAVPAVEASGVSAVEFTVKVVEDWAGVAAIMLATIIAATSRPAASALVFVPHTGAFLLVWMVISPCSFLPLRVWVGGSWLVRLMGL
jgi:hypothetical protein